MSALLGRIAAVALALCIGPAPAQAASDPRLHATSGPRLHVETITLAPGGGSKLAPIWATVPTSGVYTVRLTVDHSGVAGFASVAPADVGHIITGDVRVSPSAYPGSPCTGASTRFTCTYVLGLSERRPLPIGTLVISPRRGADTGASGPLRITATLNGATRSATSGVRVGEAVDLQAVETGPFAAPAGGAAKTDLLVRNASTTPVDGIVLHLGADSRLLAPVTHRNCSADESGLVCTFDTTLAPGTTYRLSELIEFRPPTDSITGSRMLAAAHWMTATEWADMRAALDPEAAGTGSGPALTLIEATTAAERPQADVDDTDNWARVVLDVTGGRRTDIVARGARSTVAVGERAVVRVGLRTRGAGRLHPDLYANNLRAVTVRVPGGTEVVRLPSTCHQAGDRVLWCLSVPPRFDHELVLRAGKAGARAGRVTVVPADPELPALDDPDRANDTAPLVITGTGSPESLPITGAGGAAALGLSLLVVGGIGRTLSRRRSRTAG